MARKSVAVVEQRRNAADIAAEINKALGTDVLRLGNDPQFNMEYIPTGLLPFDILLQGGMPRGRHVEIYGDYSTLKSYAAYNMVKTHQERGIISGVVDTEHAWSTQWAEEIGIDTSNVILERPETGEEALDTVEAMARNGVGFITVDSVATLLPQDEQGKRMHKESTQPGRQANLMSKALRKITAAMNNETSVLWINQTRMSIGITFGNPETTPGGKALPFYASYRINVRKTGKIVRDVPMFDGQKWMKSAKEQIGQKYRLEVVKSKLSKPFREIWFDWNLISNQIDIPTFCLAQGLELGLVEQKGASWRFEDFKAVGRENFVAKLIDNPDVLLELENSIRGKHDLPMLEGTTKTSPVAKPKKLSTSRGALQRPKKAAGGLRRRS